MDSMRRTGVVMLTLGWLGVGGLLWWAFDRALQPDMQVGVDAQGLPEVRIERGRDGHYTAPGLINGQPVLFMVDTGASGVAIPIAVARRLGLRPGPPQRSHTAAGIVETRATRLDSVALGGLEARDVTGSILPDMPGEAILLGMSYLSRFDVRMVDNEMHLRARGAGP